MTNQFTVIFERDEDWSIAYCPEIPGANGQGKTRDENTTEPPAGRGAYPR